MTEKKRDVEFESTIQATTLIDYFEAVEDEL